jgi:hypothetical protein
MLQRCEHGPLDSGSRLKQWIRKNSLVNIIVLKNNNLIFNSKCKHKSIINIIVQTARKIEKAIRGHKDMRLKDISMMTEYSHTGVNESLNNLHNLYMPKSCFFK